MSYSVDKQGERYLVFDDETDYDVAMFTTEQEAVRYANRLNNN